MALGIEKDNVYTTWTIPLQPGDLPGEDIQNWKDNSWIVEHLRQLANKIEQEQPRIYSIGLTTDCQYKTPTLQMRLFEKK